MRTCPSYPQGNPRPSMQRHLQVLAFCTLVASPAHAQPLVDFAGRTITIISSFGPGGGYTIYADLIARRLGAHLPGRPTVIVKTMPGAGGMNGTQYLANAAP